MHSAIGKRNWKNNKRRNNAPGWRRVAMRARDVRRRGTHRALWPAPGTTISHYFPQHLASTSNCFALSYVVVRRRVPRWVGGLPREPSRTLPRREPPELGHAETFSSMCHEPSDLPSSSLFSRSCHPRESQDSSGTASFSPFPPSLGRDTPPGESESSRLSCYTVTSTPCVRFSSSSFLCRVLPTLFTTSPGQK